MRQLHAVSWDKNNPNEKHGRAKKGHGTARKEHGRAKKQHDGAKEVHGTTSYFQA